MGRNWLERSTEFRAGLLGHLEGCRRCKTPHARMDLLKGNMRPLIKSHQLDNQGALILHCAVVSIGTGQNGRCQTWLPDIARGLCWPELSAMSWSMPCGL